MKYGCNEANTLNEVNSVKLSMKQVSVLLARHLLCASSILITLVLEGCQGQPPKAKTEERSFQMGAIYWTPQQAADTVVKKGVKYMLDNSDVLTAQIPWTPTDADFLKRVKWIADLAHDHERSLIVNLDWLADNRKGIRGTGWRFAQPTTQQKFIETALSICEQYHPDYLNLGVETNFYALTDSADFKAFLRTYHTTKQLVNKRFPATKVSVSLQLELLMGNHTGWSETATMEVFNAFNNDFDIVALSTYPHSNTREFDNFKSLTKLLQQTKKPFGIFETSVPTSLYSEQKQDAYLTELLTYLQQSRQCKLLVWTSIADTQPLASKQPWIHYLGLYQSNFTPKKAASAWASWRSRPLRLLNDSLKAAGSETATVVR